jgi:hypothetical protein
MLATKDWSSQGLDEAATPSAAAYSTYGHPEGDKLTGIGGQESATAGQRSDTWESEWVTPDREIASMLVRLFSEVEAVSSIFAQFTQDGILIWTLLRDYDRAAREEIYAREMTICERLRLYDFDFRATSVEVVNPESLIRAGARQIFRRP